MDSIKDTVTDYILSKLDYYIGHYRHVKDAISLDYAYRYMHLLVTVHNSPDHNSTSPDHNSAERGIKDE